jgi:hypothetical protein
VNNVAAIALPAESVIELLGVYVGVPATTLEFVEPLALPSVMINEFADASQARSESLLPVPENVRVELT